jgi:hypothetical protein
MPRQFFDRASGQWVDEEEYAFRRAMNTQQSARSDLPGPMIIHDTMEPVQSQLDGKFYDSKAALRSTYKAAGVVEVGNDSSVLDPKPFKKPKPKREEIKASVHKAFSKVGLGA